MSDWLEAENHVERAHELYEAGRWEEAESLLRKALSLNPYHAEWHFNLGLTLEASGQFEEAAASFERSFDLGGEDDIQPAISAGLCRMRAEQHKEAIAWFERASEIDPKDPAPMIHRIEAYTYLGQHEQAEVMFYLAQQLDPEHPDAFVALSESLLDRNMYDKAVWCLREAARLDPELPRIQARLAEAYAKTGRQERARQLYLRELRTSPGDIDTLLDLGELLVEMNRATEAGEKFRRVLEIEPDNADALFDLGDLCERQRQFGDAESHFDVVVRLDPEYPEARRRLARLLIETGDENKLTRARDLLIREAGLLRKREADAEELDDLGQLLLSAELAAEAVSVFKRLAELRPNTARAHHDLSVAYFEVGNIGSGMDEARKALRLDPRFVPALYNMALACMQQRQWKRARYWVTQARRTDPDDSSLRRLRLMLRLHALMEVAEWSARVILRRRPVRKRPAR